MFEKECALLLPGTTVNFLSQAVFESHVITGMGRNTRSMSLKKTTPKAEKFVEELKMNLKCDEDEDHPAVLYCAKCEANLCVVCSKSLHSRKVLSNHVVVRLTEKPEPPIYCYIHPERIAELVCKDPFCYGKNKPICIMCRQHGSHENHKYKFLEEEYDEIRGDIESNLKNIDQGLAMCDESLEYHDKCISSFSTVDAGLWRRQREDIDKFYTKVRSSALWKFDNFTTYRLKDLKYSKRQHTIGKTRLTEMSTKFKNVGEMSKHEVFKNRETVKMWKEQSRRMVEKPSWFQPAECCTITYPNTDGIFLKIDESIGSTNVKTTKKEMRIYVKTLTGKVMTLQADPMDTINDLKTMIHDIERIPTVQQRLIYNREQLENERLLLDYNIRNHSILTLVERLGGPI